MSEQTQKPTAARPPVLTPQDSSKPAPVQPVNANAGMDVGRK